MEQDNFRSAKGIAGHRQSHASIWILLFGILSNLAAAVGRLSGSNRIDTLKALEGFKVEPGDIELERGSSVTVSATFRNTSPLEVQLVVNPSEDQEASVDPASEQSWAMRRALKDPVFSHLLSNVRQSVQYKVYFDGASSDLYHIRVFDYPEVVRSDALLKFPTYTELSEQKIENTKRVRMVEGTELQWDFYLNKEGITCKLISDSGETVESVVSDDPKRHRITMTPKESMKWKIELADDAAATQRWIHSSISR